MFYADAYLPIKESAMFMRKLIGVLLVDGHHGEL